ncbi:MAG: hypothetical protein LBB83_12505 [Treponema sp.]|nr:hypothetical protein [Treponema sp.]
MTQKLLSKTAWLIVTLLGVIIPAKSFAADYIDGRIKLTLNESTGRFSLYYLTDRAVNRFEPLFSDQDPRTSSLSIMINERVYRLGEAPSFTARIGGTQANPSLVFESPGMVVTEEFSFLSLNRQSETTGVRVNIRLENRGNRASTIGARLIIDTKLGESANTNVDHYTTSDRGIRSETLLDQKWPDKWWISRNNSCGLMGSISTGYSTAADFVHFANWKRLNDATWELQYNRRNFTNPPYSINDSAVSYVFNPQRLPAGESRVYSILLAAADENGFAQVAFKSGSTDTRPPAAPAAPASPAQNPASSTPSSPPERTAPPSRQSSEEETMRNDLAILRDLLSRLDDYHAGRVTLSEEELANIELILNRIKDRYQGR